MKKIILFLLFSISSFGQKAIYNKIEKSGNFTEYQTKEGAVIKISDTITIGYPLGQTFTFITQGNTPTVASLSNNKVVVSKIKSAGNATRGYKIYLLFKGYGISCYIDYEAALETGEIKNPFIQ